jgi:hypothetical protein
MSNERPKIVQELARHSKIDLTMNVYTHAGLHDLQSAVDGMPDHTPAPPLKADAALRPTGTDGVEVCMRIGHTTPQTGAHECTDSGSGNLALSCAFTGENAEKPKKGEKWSDGESNPDLLNAIQPSSR